MVSGAATLVALGQNPRPRRCSGTRAGRAGRTALPHFGPGRIAALFGRLRVPQFAEIEGSFASGNTLVNLESGSAINVPDRFLLCALRQNRPAHRAGVLSRLGELYGKTEAHLLWKHLLLNKEG